MKIGISHLLFGLFAVPAFAQQLPVLRTNQTQLDVRDGHNLYKNYWTVSPGAKKDVYFAHRFKGSDRVTFYAGTDSLTFKVNLNRTYDFLIVLNGKDTCLTEISTVRSTYYKAGRQVVNTDTIAFTLGKDNRIYFAGSINGSPPLKFFFDDGADNTILMPSAIRKGAQPRFDDSIANRATGGMQRTSNFNDVAIAKLKWRNEQVMYVEKQIGEGDGTIGYDLFEDKLIEIDYEKQLMILHDKAFQPGRGYRRFSMDLKGGEVPWASGTVLIGTQKITADFLFDMGATGCLFLNQGFLKKNNLYGKMAVTGEAKSTGAGSAVVKTIKAILPQFTFGNYSFRDVPVNLENPAEHDPGTGVLGMDLLKRFNMILDYQHNLIWLKPNQLASTPFKQ